MILENRAVPQEPAYAAWKKVTVTVLEKGDCHLFSP